MVSSFVIFITMLHVEVMELMRSVVHNHWGVILNLRFDGHHKVTCNSDHHVHVSS
jgi:hypothetical protein